MKVIQLMVTFFGMQAATAAWPQIQQKEKNNILKDINKLRSNIKPSMANYIPVTWDYNLERDIKAMLPQNRSKLFDNSTKYHNEVDFRVDFNLMFLMREPQFKNYTNHNYVFHDTCNLKVGDVYRIFRYRSKQQKCMDYNKCNSTEFTNYETCLKKPVPRKEGLPCSWAWRYVSPLVRDDLKTIACVRFSRPGPYTPNKQKDSFGCYGEMKTPINDVPYKIKVKAKL